MLKLLKSRDAQKKTAEALLRVLVAQAREPYFYEQLGVPDTLDGRFDMVVLHAWLVLASLRAKGEGDLAQRLIDQLFGTFDEGLRELGAGDIGMGRRIKKMASAFYGRLAAYDAAHDEGAMADALLRNVYRGAAEHSDDARGLAMYVRSQRSGLAVSELSAGKIAFAPPPDKHA